jgi:sugar phosphate permease
MCNKYNHKYIVFIALIVGGICNHLFGIMPIEGFKYLKYILLVNGFAMASLWSTIILLFKKIFI